MALNTLLFAFYRLLQNNKIAKLDGWQFNRMYYLKEL